MSEPVRVFPRRRLRESVLTICIALSITAIRPLVLDGEGKVLAYDLSISYDDADKTSYEVAVAVGQRLSGHRLGALLSTYGAILGWERGRPGQKIDCPSIKRSFGKKPVELCRLLCGGFHPRLSGSNGSPAASLTAVDPETTS